MMGGRSIKIRFMAAFVFAFVCLNANAAVCVAYCQSFESTTSESPEHRPGLKKHCEKSKKTPDRGDFISVSAGGSESCPIAVRFFAAPIEKTSTSFARHPVETAPQFRSIVFAANAGRQPVATTNYRGPPLRDLREFRVRYCILRV